MEKFFLNIDAKTAKENSINTSSKCELDCTGHFAISVIINVLEKDDDLREVFEASLRIIKEKKLTEGINMN
jgi:hypothetical protein